MAYTFTREYLILLVRLDVILSDTGCLWGFRTGVQKLQRTILSLQEIIPAAEEHPQHFRLASVLRKLKDAFDEVDYLLRGFEFEGSIRRRVLGNGIRAYCSSLESQLSYAFKIRSINRKLDKLQADFREYSGLLSIYTTVVDAPGKRLQQYRETTSYVNPSQIVGREEEKEKIIHQLISTQEAELIRVIPIVGIGGLGKTTLAQLVFNDERLLNMQFELRIWACAAGTTSLDELLCLIIDALRGPVHHYYYRKNLEYELSKYLRGKKYLLVLDDVHDIDPQTCFSLKHLLMKMGGNGSRIIVTTRRTDIAENMGTVPPFWLQGLSSHDSWSLFLRSVDFQVRLQDEETKMEIVRKCRGNPLVVREMGAMLFHGTVEDWHTVRNSDREIWEIQVLRDRLLSALKLSYDHLPYDLRRCFKFCSFFPKDYEFGVFELIQFWEASGLIDSTATGMDYLRNFDSTATGMDYLSRLWSLSLLKRCKGEGAFSFKYQMPQLIHDLAPCLVHGDFDTVKPSTEVIDKWLRHLRLVAPSENTLHSVTGLWHRIGYIQTLIFVDKVEQSVVESFIQRCQHLRVLILRNSGLQTLPRGIEGLKSLKYLDLSGYKRVTEIPMLPSLKTLILEGCGIKELPRGIEGLKSLKYLDLTGNEMVEEIPNSICMLQNLETLILEGCTSVEELPRDIKNLSHLTMLSITTKQTFLPENGVGALTSLRYLAIIRCPTLKYLPQGIHLLTSLTTLIIRDCRSLSSLPRSMKYLIALKTLVIANCPELRLNREVVGEEHLNAFGLSLHRCCLTSLPRLTNLPQWLVRKSAKTLKSLQIEDCQSLELIPDWFTGDHLTSLNEVEFVNCKNLWHPRGIKPCFSAFVKIKIESCPNLTQPSLSNQSASRSQIPKSSIGGNRQMMEKGKENFGSRKPAQGHATILSIATANPANYILQHDFSDYYSRVTKSEHMTQLKENFKRICDEAKVRKRHFVLTEEMIKKNPNISNYDGKSLDLRDQIITSEVPKLALEAASEAIKEWGQPKSHITHLIFAAVSGGDMLDYHLMKLLGLPPSVKRTMMYLRSSYASGTMLRMAKDIAENNTGSRVLVVSCNISIGTFRVPNESDIGSLIANATTGDGAAALIIGADLDVMKERPLFQIVSMLENIVPDSDGAINREVHEQGPSLSLTKDVPEMIATYIENSLKQALSPIDVTDWNSFFWVIHPGGNAIMDRIETQLGLKKEKLWASRHVLSEFGNMCAATVFFALDEMRRKSVEAGKTTTGDGLEWGIVFGLGAGITIDTVVLRSFATTTMC